ncbi:MAG: phenylalanine--tRNA ligase subunit beta [Clostridiales bacterium]|nr:phenylalanine--tRNA ligase subunit beta [Clostridiales bacterium]
MLLSRKWLNEFVPVDANDRDFAEDMTLSGSKVEVTEIEGEEISNVVVGRVVEIKRHENSDHMWICQVDVGEEAPVQIVTGAQNVSQGDLVPVAKHNSTLPGGIHIKKGKLRGEVSNGMLCSYKELGMTDNDWPYSIVDGIFLLDSDPDLKAKGLKPGDEIRAAIGLDDHVVEFEITPNRPDCLSVIGLAREAAVTYGKKISLHEPVVKGGGPGNLSELLDVETPATDLCPRYTARMVRNVKIGPSPKWMRDRLRASGVRPINNIVDITNYVMLEYGQPMHAFDYRYVKGGKIVVRRAEDGETLTTLDGNVRNLNSSMLVIADETRAVGLAGIMGGENSEIVEDTVDVVFESANFNGTCIRRTALALGMRTEASAKFEKGLDILNTLPAVNRACELVEMLGAGEVLDGVIDILNFVPQPKQLALRPEKINELLGTDIDTPEMCRILTELGFGVEGETITVPSWRGDVEHYSDLAEEVARFYGYNQIPTTSMKGVTTRGGYSPEQLLERSLGNVCRGMGYDEIITYSFISPTYYDKIRLPEDSPLRKSMKIMNPLGEDTSIMRTTVMPSMLEILTRNYNYRNKSAHLYELGRTYFEREDGMADEPKLLSLGVYGPDESFFTLKGAVETVLESIRAEDVTYEAEKTNPSYHPGRCAKVYVKGQEVGILGQIHPLVAANYGVDAELYYAELRFDALFASRGADPEYTPLPKFPAVTRDIAVLVDVPVTVGALEACIRSAAKGLLKDVTLFDIYQGANLPSGKKSVAFNLVLRADDRSLTAQEADDEVKVVLERLEKDFGATLR